jgi:serine/threonine-protein kinase
MASHGRYTILGKLADGGMAEIFLAVQHGAEGFQKTVVMKRILTQYSADPQFRNMLLDEAHIGMSLQHSNIVQILDLGVAGGRYFLALELVDGWDLEKILQRARAAGMIWPAALGLHVTAAVCRALSYAHAKTRDGKPLGIVHRDVSPNNVLVSDQGEVKLTDFGIAKAQRKREQTAAGVIKGKVAYMSPEQGLGGVVDKRSDIFSVGSMLYRMMTDHLPFEADNDMESLLRVQKAEFQPPEKVRPTVGPAVSSIIMRAMRLAPSERYQTADEMLADVERVLRNDFHSAGQTELKLWLEQLGRRDDAPTIGKHRVVDTSGVVADAVGTDLSVGTSFELSDLEKAGSMETEVSGTRRVPQSRAPGESTAEVPLPQPAPPKRRSGFWWGAAFALAAVIGARYLQTWAEQRGMNTSSVGLGGDSATPKVGPAPNAPAPSPTPQASPAPKPPAPTALPSIGAVPAPAAPPTVATTPTVAPDAAPARANAEATPDAAAAVAAAEKAPAAKPAAAAPEAEDDDEPDEEALLRTAVPNPESAVIGDDEEKAKPAPKNAAKPGVAPATPAHKVETAILHITTAPAGAVVRTKYKVLGQTPINLHFKSGNIYDIMFLKRGYQPTTKRVEVRGTKDRKLAVTLKKKPVPARRRSFFHPHR